MTKSSTETKTVSSVKKNDVERRIEMFNDVDIVLQVHKSHSDRLCEYLMSGVYHESHYKDNKNVDGPVIIESAKRSKTVSIIYLSSRLKDPKKLAITIRNDENLTFAVTKIFLVEKGSLIQRGDLKTDVVKAVVTKIQSLNQEMNNIHTIDEISTTTKRSLDGSQKSQQASSSPKKGIRLQLFPPNLQTSFLSNIENSLTGLPVEFSPTSFMYILSIVQVCEKEGLFLLGLSKLSGLDDNNLYHGYQSVEKNDDAEVCRAYRKLEEAFRRYQHNNTMKNRNSNLIDRLKNSVALDCGAAPGGWTQFLIKQVNCQKVYSVDPGLLSQSVMRLHNVEYMQMKIEDAIQILQRRDEQKNNNTKINLWVSDMCLQNMEDQLETMIIAHKAGILAKNTFFILTMKCFKGHSKTAYDEQVDDVLNGSRFKSISTEGVDVIHLFSNRKGERTVMGFINNN